jgi:hypothetical protein
MTFEDKFCPKFTAKPTAKLMFATNELPHFSDKSDGIWRRPLYVPMEHKVSEEDKVPGMDAVSFWEPHLPGLLCWSLDGLRRLRERHWRFTQPESSAAAARASDGRGLCPRLSAGTLLARPGCRSTHSQATPTRWTGFASTQATKKGKR